MIVFALSAALAGTASPAPALPSLPPAMVHTAMPSFGAANTAIAVKARRPFQIRLAVTSGTGYTWRPQGPLPPGMTLLGVFSPARGRQMPGGPGAEVLVFRAGDVGQMKLTLEYVRAWERAKPAKTQTFTVRVHE